MTSESTRFLGQPSETKPTVGRLDEWTVQRLAGPALDAVASQAPVGKEPDQVAGDPPR